MVPPPPTSHRLVLKIQVPRVDQAQVPENVLQDPAVDAANADFPGAGLVDVNAVRLDGTRYTHMQQVQARLDFLEYVLLNSSVEVSATERGGILHMK